MYSTIFSDDSDIYARHVGHVDHAGHVICMFGLKISMLCKVTTVLSV